MVAHGKISFLFMAEKYSIVCVCVCVCVVFIYITSLSTHLYFLVSGPLVYEVAYF